MCQLLVIDVQQRLVPVIHDSERIIERCGWIMDLASDMQIPITVTEQHPEGLGPTVDTLRSRVADDAVFVKTHFSALNEPGFGDHIDRMKRSQLVVIGMESHVCVLQTVLPLCAAGWSVFPVADALGSRDPEDQGIALQRMDKAGATLVTSEMLFFEWLRRADSSEATRLLSRYMTGS